LAAAQSRFFGSKKAAEKTACSDKILRRSGSAHVKVAMPNASR